MKRLTIRNSDGSVSQPMDLRWGDALKRLAAYEDTGLEPERVETVKTALMGKCLAEIKEINDLPVERMIELAEAEHDGRLVVQPCAPGAEVWVVERQGRYAVGAHRYMFLAKAGDAVILTHINGFKNARDALAYHIQESALDFAELAVFPADDCYTTREEAEKALEREAEDDGSY